MLRRNAIPHSLTTIPTQNAATAKQKQVLVSNMLPSTISTTANAASTPDNAIFLAFTCMSKDRLPYIHTSDPHTTDHNTYFPVPNVGLP